MIPAAAHGMVYDASRDRVVRYGGGGGSCSGSMGQTWEWDGEQWLRRLPVVSPPVRELPEMVYDSYRQLTVMFGGDDVFRRVYLNDLWVWDGVTWTERITAVRPPARNAHMMAYDAARRCIVLFGGKNSAQYFDDTWIWDGTTWHEQHPASHPPAFIEGAMGYDPRRGRVVLVGGRPADQTWEWDGSEWILRQPARRPPARVSAALAYDPQRGMMVLFGGIGGPTQYPNDAWGWDGTTWTRIATAGPPGRDSLGMVYDSKRGRLLIHGGGNLGIFSYSCVSDTWVLPSPTPGFAGFGAGCPGRAGMPVLALGLRLPPGAGGALTLELRNLPAAPAPQVLFALGFSRQQWGTLALPWPLTSLGLPACGLWVAPALVVPATSQAAGSATLAVPIATPIRFYAQGLILDQGTLALSAAATVEATPGAP